MDKSKIQILDLEQPILNSTKLNDGKKGGYPPYTLAEVVILSAYKINEKKKQNEIRLMVIPIDDQYHSYQFEQMMALKDFYNILGIIHVNKYNANSPSRFVAFLILKNTSEFIYLCH